MKTAGFSLLELLIAVLIFSVGLLGIASLQILSMQLTSDSYHRSIATLLANNMIDRMRANVADSSLGKTSQYNNWQKTVYPSNPACYGYGTSGQVDTAVSCSPSDMAQSDFADWYASIKGAPASSWYPAVAPELPGADGVVCIDSTPNDGTPSSPNCDNNIVVSGKPIYSIKIWWTERKDVNAPGTLHQYVTSFSL